MSLVRVGLSYVITAIQHTHSSNSRKKNQNSSNLVAVLAFLMAGNMFMFHSFSILSCPFWLLYSVKLKSSNAV